MKRRIIFAHVITFCLVLVLFFILKFSLEALITTDNLATTLAAVITLVLFTPLQTLVQSKVPRMIDKNQIFLQSQLLQLKEEVQYITHLLRLQRVLVRRIAELMRVQFSSLFIFNESANVYELSDGLGITPKDKRKIQFKSSGGLLVWLKMEKGALYLSTLVKHKRYQYLGKEEKEKLKRLQAELCIPLMLGEKIVGVLFLGRKTNKAPYKDEEIDLLQQVANQAAQAIMNATAQRNLSSIEREVMRGQNRIRNLENRINEDQKTHQNLLDYLKTGILVLKLDNKIVELNQSFKESILPDLDNRFQEFLDATIPKEKKPTGS